MLGSSKINRCGHEDAIFSRDGNGHLQTELTGAALANGDTCEVVPIDSDVGVFNKVRLVCQEEKPRNKVYY